MLNINKEEIELEETHNGKCIKFRESIANVSNDLYFDDYYDRYTPSIFGNLYGEFRFSEIYQKKKLTQQILIIKVFKIYLYH